MAEGRGKGRVFLMAYEQLGKPWNILHSNNLQARKIYSLDPRGLFEPVVIMLLFTNLVSDPNCGAFGETQRGAERVTFVVDRWLKEYNYSFDKDLMPYMVKTVRDQVPRALKVIT